MKKTKTVSKPQITPAPYVHVPYLEATDEGAFLDMPVKPTMHEVNPCYNDSDYIHCPVCQGHGGWNLRLNAYGAGQHFQCFCTQCNGYGWVRADGPNAKCIHENVEVSQEECSRRGLTHYGRCWHVTECKKCGLIGAYDSSD